MAAAVKYFDVAKMGHVRLTTGAANTDGSVDGTAISWFNSAPAADWMLTKIIFSSSSGTGIGDLADSLIHIFVSDNTTDRLIRTIDIGNPLAGSVSLGAYQIEVNFGPEFIFPSTMQVRIATSVTPTVGNLDAVIFAQAA